MRISVLWQGQAIGEVTYKGGKHKTSWDSTKVTPASIFVTGWNSDNNKTLDPGRLLDTPVGVRPNWPIESMWDVTDKEGGTSSICL